MNYTLVGAFVLLLGTALVAGILWLAAGGNMQKNYDLYLALEDESVDGLNVNAPVKYNGVDVGKVREIRLDPATPDRVRLLFAIERGTPVKTDTVAVLSTQGLTGIAYVELSGGAANAAPLLATVPGQYPIIRTKPSLSARLENVLTTVLAKLDHTSGNVDALLSSENRLAFKSALADIASVAHTVAARKETLNAAMTNAGRTFHNGAQATAQMEPVLRRIGSAADAVEKMGNDMALAGTDAAKTVDSVGTNVNRLTTETLPELQRLLGELNVLSASLRRLSENTERGPASLLFGHSVVPDGPGEGSVKVVGESSKGANPP